MNLSEIGRIAEQIFENIPDHFQFVTADACIIMPEHVDGIIIINDHIIRNENALNRIRRYLMNNPINYQRPGDKS